MRKNSVKNTRVNGEVMRVLADIIRGDIKDPRIGMLTSVVNVEVAPETNVIEEADEQDTENVDAEDDTIDTPETEDNVEDVEEVNETFEESTEETECDGSMDETSDEADNDASFEHAED